MIRLLLLAIAVGALTIATTSSARAECGYVTQVAVVQGAEQVNTVYVCHGASQQVHTSSDAALPPPRDSDLDTNCVRTAIEVGHDPFEFCDLPPDAQLPDLTPGLVAAAFQRIPLPPSNLLVQPPGGTTLVNLETNFYTDNHPFTRHLTLLGHHLTLRITPTHYTWHFGDHTTHHTTEPGTPYPHLQITHRYTTATTVHPTLETTYTAQYRTPHTPWTPVPGTATIPGPPHDLDITTATPVLVGHR